MNLQPAMKQTNDPMGALVVHSIFPTIQGEGPFTGHRAIFVRLSGCNLACPQCDTTYTRENSPLQSPESVVEAINALALGKQLVVITGGEPFRQNLSPAIQAILAAGYQVQIETNGTLYQDLPYGDITVVCSPKTGSVHKRLEPHIAALKYVLDADSVAEDDGLPVLALGHTASPRLARPPKGFQGKVYIQPVDSGNAKDNLRHLDAAILSTVKYGYILCLQTHKIIGME